jgi:hypothetical protein
MTEARQNWRRETGRDLIINLNAAPFNSHERTQGTQREKDEG